MMKPTEAATSVGWWRYSARYPFFRVVPEPIIPYGIGNRQEPSVVADPNRIHGEAMRHRVTCTTNHPSGERITHLGCVTNTSFYQLFSEEEAIAQIEVGEMFYVERPTGHSVKVVIARRERRKYLKTESDGEKPDNLLSLPDCPAKKTDKPCTVRVVTAAASHCAASALQWNAQ